MQFAFAEAARKLIGAPFRLRGRDPETGIDCVGLVHCALLDIGRRPPDIPRYALRNLAIGELIGLLPAAGFTPASGPVRPGDILMVEPSPGQFHLAIASAAATIIQAHAGLGRVVETSCQAEEPFALYRLS